MDILLFLLAILLTILVLVPIFGMFTGLGLLAFLPGEKEKQEKDDRDKTWEELYGHPFPPPLYQDSFEYAYDCAAKLREKGDEADAKQWEDAVKPFKAFGRDN